MSSSSGFFGIAGTIGVFDSQNELAFVVAREKPVEQSGPSAADVEITSRRRSKSDPNFSTSDHFRIGRLE